MITLARLRREHPGFEWSCSRGVNLISWIGRKRSSAECLVFVRLHVPGGWRVRAGGVYLEWFTRQSAHS